jgi:hypothetical protein
LVAVAVRRAKGRAGRTFVKHCHHSDFRFEHEICKFIHAKCRAIMVHPPAALQLESVKFWEALIVRIADHGCLSMPTGPTKEKSWVIAIPLEISNDEMAYIQPLSGCDA